MDKQLEFLMHLQYACQPLVEYFVETQDKYGTQQARMMWADRNNAYMEKTYPVGTTTLGDDLVRDIFLCACIYVDLLIRWGVFEADNGE
jgi:hypothetical protein